MSGPGEVRQNPQSGTDQPVAKKGKMALWLKRIGVAGFLFFLVKGLVWIGVFVFIGKGCGW